MVYLIKYLLKINLYCLYMQKNKLKKGFTLIELLVVVAIIGILASVVLANLNNARAKSADTAIKASVSNARAQAALYYDDTGQTYTGVCDLVNGAVGPLVLNAYQRLNGLATDINSDLSVAYVYSASGATNESATCHEAEDGTAWAAIVSLRLPTLPDGGWCVDSSGAAREASTLAADESVCP